MKILTPEQIRAIDKRAIAGGIPSLLLMKKAGEALAQAVMDLITAYARTGPIGILCGKGNNGGDGFAAATDLAARGYKVDVFALYPGKELSPDALHFYRKAKAQKKIKWPVLTEQALTSCSVLVDALLGTGYKGMPQEKVASTIDLINASGVPVVSADVPSGLDAATGEAKKAVQATITVSMGYAKSGFLLDQAMNHVGSLRVADIGIPPQYANAYASDYSLITKEEIVPLISRRPRISHKGDYGHLLIVGGSAGMSGAVMLSARAALRAGCGLVTIACHPAIQSTVHTGCLEAMTLDLDSNIVETANNDRFDAILIGPGLGRGEAATKIVSSILDHVDKPLIIDADALYAIAHTSIDLHKAKSKKIILTPHAGEFSALLGQNKEYEKKCKWSDLSNFSAKSGAIVVLKLHIMAISKASFGLYLYLGGNAGMATAGTGDVLGGLIASFVTQGMKDLDAAKVGVFVHALAGDLAAEKLGQRSLLASDLIEHVPQALRQITWKA